MWRQADFDRLDLVPSPNQPHLPVNEPNKTLHPIQDGLNLELNSWSPRSILCFLDNRRVIEPLEISYFFVCWLDRKQTPSSELWEKWKSAGWTDFQAQVGNSAFWSFPRSGFFHSSFTHRLCDRAHK